MGKKDKRHQQVKYKARKKRFAKILKSEALSRGLTVKELQDEKINQRRMG